MLHNLALTQSYLSSFPTIYSTFSSILQHARSCDKFVILPCLVVLTALNILFFDFSWKTLSLPLVCRILSRPLRNLPYFFRQAQWLCPLCPITLCLYPAYHFLKCGSLTLTRLHGHGAQGPYLIHFCSSLA